MIRALISELLNVLYPSHASCTACGALHTVKGTMLCNACLSDFTPFEGPFCPVCGRPGWAVACPHCSELEMTGITSIRTAYPYQGTAGLLVRTLKYHGIRTAVSPLAVGMAQALPPEHFDALVPVPLYPQRQKKRGFNQSFLLCQNLSICTGLPVWNVLCRTHNTAPQARGNGAFRRRNLNGAFSVIENVEGLHLLLVDDVLTTGSTVSACAQALIAQGAAEVSVLCAARAGF